LHSLFGLVAAGRLVFAVVGGKAGIENLHSLVVVEYAATKQEGNQQAGFVLQHSGEYSGPVVA
jgi:hypothetical protein